MKGGEYIKFLERWDFIDNLTWENAINNIKPEIIEDLLNEWSRSYIQSFKNDSIWGKNVGLPLIPTSAIGQINSDLIANIALYDDRQIIQDPIDIALKEAAVNPLEYTPRFVSFLKKELREVIKLKPLLDENLIELMPCESIISTFSTQLQNQLEKDWYENKSLQYIEKRMKWKLYRDSNILAFQVGDLNEICCEKFCSMGGSIIKETEETIEVPWVMPSNLEGIDENRIQDWIHCKFHSISASMANAINKRILFAELFSGSIATDEMLTYEFIKRKNDSLRMAKGNQQLFVHKIPILGKVNLEKFIDFRSNELPSFVSFREEWKNGNNLFNGEISSESWSNNLNLELEKCKIELDKNKKRIFGNVMESSVWAGIGIAVGVCSGGLLKPIVLAHLVRLARDIKNDWATYLETRNSNKTSSAFFLLNVIDKRSLMVKTDIPRDLPAKMETDYNLLKKSIPLMEGMPIIREDYPQGKKDDLPLH